MHKIRGIHLRVICKNKNSENFEKFENVSLSNHKYK